MSDERESPKVLNEEQFTLRLYAVTWNMNSKLAPKPLHDLLDMGRGLHDLYMVGIQEAPKGGVESSVASALGEGYRKVAGASLLSIQLLLFVRSDLHSLIRDVRTDVVATGLGGIMGNKGAVAVALSCLGMRLLFVTCHLAAHQENVAERNAQYTRICSELFTRNLPASPSLSRSNSLNSGSSQMLKTCGNGVPGEEGGGGSLPGAGERGDLEPSGGEEAAASSTPLASPLGGPGALASRFDAVVWSGDLNYRVQANRRCADHLIAEKDFEVLKANDQLRKEREKGTAFCGFEEGAIDFPPTFKYNVNEDVYDTSAKMRVPSWTDRILYWVQKGVSIHVMLERYSAVSSIKCSDHRPVFALLQMSISSQDLVSDHADLVEEMGGLLCSARRSCCMQ